MTGYTLAEIRACIAQAHAHPFKRVHRRPTLTLFFATLADAFEELNAALLASLHASNHDGKWN